MMFRCLPFSPSWQIPNRHLKSSNDHFVPFRFISITDPSSQHSTPFRVSYKLSLNKELKCAGKLTCNELNYRSYIPVTGGILTAFLQEGNLYAYSTCSPSCGGNFRSLNSSLKEVSLLHAVISRQLPLKFRRAICTSQSGGRHGNWKFNFWHSTFLCS